MKVVDLHPEELLDKDARGELTESESARLEAHLARCATCRFEREVRADFASEVDHEVDLHSQHLLALIEGIPKPQPATVEAPPVASPPGLVTPSSRPARVRKNTRIVLLIAAALFVGSVATAGASARVWARVAATFSGPTPETVAVLTAAPAPVPRRTPVTARTVTPAEAPADDAVDPATTATATPSVATRPPPPAFIAVSARAPSATPFGADTTDSAATIFDSANEARRQGDYARAIFLHRRLQITHPSSREAHVSYGTVGRLLLDRGDVVGALSSFDAYQARGRGPLDEAVLVGRATALERLGRSDEAGATWSLLLSTFPDTPYAEHARVRVLGAAQH